MKRFIKLIAYSILLAGLAFTYACSDKKTPDPVPIPEVKTLKKELLYNKVWYEPITHHEQRLNSNGVFGTSGTWEWLNNSDSMAIKETPLSQTFIWYFKYCTEHEMECALGWHDPSKTWTKYKDTP